MARPCEECGNPLPSARTQRRRFCPDCVLARHKRSNARWRAENPDKVAALHAAWNKENKERKRESERARRKAHPEQFRERNSRYRAKNRDRIREKARANPEVGRIREKAWRTANPDQAIIRFNRRRARRRGNGVFKVSNRDLARLLIRQQARCAYCRAALDETRNLDHVLPISRGGRDAIGNLVYACPRCNNAKQSRLLADFRRESFVVL